MLRILSCILMLSVMLIGNLSVAAEGWEGFDTFDQSYAIGGGSSSDKVNDNLDPTDVVHVSRRLLQAPDAEHVSIKVTNSVFTKPTNEGKVTICMILPNPDYDVGWRNS